MNISDSGFDSGSSPEIHMEDPPMSRTHQYRKVCHHLFVKNILNKVQVLWVTLTFEDATLCLVQSFFKTWKSKQTVYDRKLIKNQGVSFKSVFIIIKSRWQWNSWRILTGNKTK